MSSVFVLLVFVAVIIVFAAFFWFWRRSPIDQVPPHLDDKQLRRLEVQDRLRQTNYQVLTAIGLGATFLITLFQFAVSTQHWSAEFDSRLRQERLTQFVEAVKQISQADGSDKTKGPSSWTANLAGIPGVRAGECCKLAAAHLLVQLGELAANGGLACTQVCSKVGERRSDPRPRFEDDEGCRN